MLSLVHLVAAYRTSRRMPSILMSCSSARSSVANLVCSLPSSTDIDGKLSPCHAESFHPVNLVSEVTIVSAATLTDAQLEALAPRVTELTNWAYRGKHEGGDERAWTGERHLLSGIRTTEESVRAMLASIKARGPQEEAMLLAVSRDMPGESSGDSTAALQPSQLLGAIHVTRPEGALGEAELGFFSVDPDLQGEGVGGKLLHAAQRHASEAMKVSSASLWVISVRSELIAWYERKGFVRTQQTAPFPSAAKNVGKPRSGEDLEFIRMEKQLEAGGQGR